MKEGQVEAVSVFIWVKTLDKSAAFDKISASPFPTLLSQNLCRHQPTLSLSLSLTTDLTLSDLGQPRHDLSGHPFPTASSGGRPTDRLLWEKTSAYGDQRSIERESQGVGTIHLGEIIHQPLRLLKCCWPIRASINP